MKLFHTKRESTPLIAAFIGGGVVAFGLVAFGVRRWIRARPSDSDNEITDFSDPYIPAVARRGSRRAVHQLV